jgi:hypothetical protein
MKAIKIVKTLFFTLGLLSTASASSFINLCSKETKAMDVQNAELEYKICTKDPQLKKSVVFIEGFDIGDQNGFANIYDQINKDQKVLETLIHDGYSIVLVNMPNSYEYNIDDNGKGLSLLLDNYWEKTPKSEPLKIIGISMGGIYATIASYYSEFEKPRFYSHKGSLIQTGVNYKSNLIMTLDSPHNGAYIPSSIQGFVYEVTTDPDIIKKTTKFKDEVAEFYKLLNGTLAKQILYHNKFSKNANKVFDSFHSKYRKIKKALKSSNKRFVGYVSGSWNGKEQGIGYGKKVVNYEFYEKSEGCIDKWTPGAAEYCGPEIELYSQRYLPKNNHVTTKVRINWCVGWKSECYEDPDIGWNRSKDCAQFGSCYNYENAAGGYQNLYRLLHAPLIAWKNDRSTVYNEGKHSFVPTNSAAAIEIDDYLLAPHQSIVDLENSMGIMENFSFFDKIYHQNQNLRHAEFQTKEQFESFFIEIHNSTMKHIVPTIITPLLLN